MPLKCNNLYQLCTMQGSNIMFESTKNICLKRIFHNAAMQNFVLVGCMSMKYKTAQIESISFMEEQHIAIA